jgi:hypothetical protein
MAINETVGINLTADTKSFRQQFKEATAELQKIQATFGEYSKEALQAAKNVASLKDRIQEAKETVDLFDPGKRLQAVTGVVNSVAGAYAGLQGALALVGVESEDVQKQLLKVQGALALSQGISTVLDSAKDFQRLGAIIKTQVVTAFSTLRGAIIATGIGALAVGLGLLVANFEKVSEMVLKAIPGLRTLGNVIGGIVQKVTDFVGITSQTDRALELFAKNSANRKATYERELKVLEAQGASEKKLSELRKKIVQEDINVLEAKKRNGKKLNDEENKQLQDANNEKLVIQANFDAKIKSDKDKRREEEKRQAQEDQKAFDDQQHAKYLSYEANEKKIYEDRIKEVKRARSITESINAQTEKNQMIRMDRIDKAIKGYKASELKIEELTQEGKLNIIANAVGAAANLIGRNTLAGKALAIAQATIDTYAGASKALSTYPPPFGAIAAGTVIAGGLANVAAIVNTKVPTFEGMSGGGSFSAPASAPIAPRFTPPAPTSLDATSLNSINNVVSRAYVVESDITGSQKRIRRIENAARI